MDLLWWISVVEVPALGGLLWLILRTRREAESGARQVRQWCEEAVSEMREGLAHHRLDVAKNYVSVPQLKDVERRLTGHLLRIEAKLDQLGFARPAAGATGDRS